MYKRQRQDWNIINNAMDNLINIILSQTTLKNVSMRLYAQGLTHLDPDNDNQYLTARTSRYLLNRTPKEVMDLVDRTSEEKTLENLRRFEEADHDNHVYGMFHWNPPYYSYQALSQIKVKRITSSDMLEISYENDDPYIVYNTLVILNDEFVRQYRDLRFGETNNVIAYFESELARVGKNLRELEDSLRDYNVEKRVINYDEQTKHVAVLSRDFELRYEDTRIELANTQRLMEVMDDRIDEHVKQLRNNTLFVDKLRTISNLTARIMRRGSSEKVTSGSHGVRMMHSSRSDIPSKGSTSSPNVAPFSDHAMALIVKSRRRWSSASVPGSTSGLRESRV